jgi:hypothetical protein
MEQYLSKLTPINVGMPAHEVLTVERLNAIQDAIFALTRGDNIQRSYGIRKRTLSNGVLFMADPAGRGGGDAAPCPWTPKIRTDDEGTKFIWFEPGNIANVIPGPDDYFSKTGGVEITGTGTEYAVMEVTTSGGVVSSATIVVQTDPADPIPVGAGAPPATFEVLLATIIDGKPYRQPCCGALQATSKKAFEVEKEDPEPMESLFIQYYTWDVHCEDRTVVDCTCECEDEGGGGY